MLVTTMRQIACDACEGDGNAFGPAFFEQHLAVVAGYAAALADALGADVEIVALAA
ncbi:MAG: hypothetical protein JXQ73_30745 [Phycisphaerae bacterium]|nr:hypothetical protein [Phycisphaerae bacterium]